MQIPTTETNATRVQDQLREAILTGALERLALNDEFHRLILGRAVASPHPRPRGRLASPPRWAP